MTSVFGIGDRPEPWRNFRDPWNGPSIPLAIPTVPMSSYYYSMQPSSASHPPYPSPVTHHSHYCQVCSPTFICPHHFHRSSLSSFYCCHLCYVRTVFHPSSPQYRRYYVSQVPPPPYVIN